MNPRSISFYIISLLSLSLYSSISFGIDDALKRKLEDAWLKYINAYTTGDMSKLSQAMSSYSYGTMTNNFISAKRELNSEWFKSRAKYLPNINDYKFARSIETGPTVGLVYVKDSERKGATKKEGIEFLFIKFVKEESKWKVGGIVHKWKNKTDENGNKARFSQEDIPKNMAIDGSVKNTPGLENSPYSSGMVDVFSYGYSTTVSINGSDFMVTKNKTSSMLIKGGLHEKGNEIKIKIKKTTGVSISTTPSVTVRRSVKNNGTEEIFKYEPTNNIEGEYNFSFP